MATHRYSLWFMPAGAVNQRLSQLIARLAERYASPTFPPHLTLLGSIEASEEEIISKTQALASQISPFPIRLATIAYTDLYYRALFVNADHSAEIVAAYQQAEKAFPRHQKTDYMPHVSLLYGYFPVETKQRIIKEIGEPFIAAFEADTLYLYLTEGAVSDWQRIRAFPL